MDGHRNQYGCKGRRANVYGYWCTEADRSWCDKMQNCTISSQKYTQQVLEKDLIPEINQQRDKHQHKDAGQSPDIAKQHPNLVKRCEPQISGGSQLSGSFALQVIRRISFACTFAIHLCISTAARQHTRQTLGMAFR